MKILRKYVREFILESARIYYSGRPTNSSADTPHFSSTGTISYSENEEGEGEEDLLIEPDSPDESRDAEIEKEASGAAAVAGATVPLGASPTYPKNRKKRKRKSR